MSEQTAPEIAARLEDSMPICEKAAVIVLRRQHVEIERLSAINTKLTAKANELVISNARLEEKIASLTAEREGHAAEVERLTAELDAAAASAALTERTAIAAQLREWADELGFEGSWRWKTPGGLLYRAAEMVSDRSKP